MDREEIYKEIHMPYKDLCNYLIEKYGGAVSDYFYTPECKSKNKRIPRTGEGLFCHHIDEDKGNRLSDCAYAKNYPFAWQKKERLVYCNILEHLILHFKIAVLRQKDRLRNPNEVMEFFTLGGSNGIFMICSDINDMFMHDGTTQAWRKRCFDEINNNYNDYIVLLKSLLAYIDMNYTAKKDNPPFLVPGSFVHFGDCDCEIIKLTEKKDSFILRIPSGEEKSFHSSVAFAQFTYLDYVNLAINNMSVGYDTLYSKIVCDIKNINNNSIISEYSLALNVGLVKKSAVGKHPKSGTG